METAGQTKDIRSPSPADGAVVTPHYAPDGPELQTCLERLLSARFQKRP